MNEADILALTYEDQVTVYRPFKDVLPSGESVFRKDRDGKKIYTDEACALSGKSGGRLNQTVSAAKVPADYYLFIRPEVDIQPNDFLEIRHLNRIVTALAGLADRQPSHNNVPVKLDKEMV